MFRGEESNLLDSTPYAIRSSQSRFKV